VVGRCGRHIRRPLHGRHLMAARWDVRHAAMKSDLVNGGRQDRCVGDAGETEAEAVRIWHSQSSSLWQACPACCRSVSDSDCRRHALWPRRDHAGDSSARRLSLSHSQKPPEKPAEPPIPQPTRPNPAGDPEFRKRLSGTTHPPPDHPGTQPGKRSPVAAGAHISALAHRPPRRCLLF
jgi:hypothetical protein